MAEHCKTWTVAPAGTVCGRKTLVDYGLHTGTGMCIRVNVYGCTY